MRVKRVNKVFNDFIGKEYSEFIQKYGLIHHDDIFNAFYNFKKKTFLSSISDDEFEEAKKEFIDSIHKVFTDKKDEIQVLIDNRNNKLKK